MARNFSPRLTKVAKVSKQEDRPAARGKFTKVAPQLKAMRSHYPEQDSNIQEKGEVSQALTTKPCLHRNSQGVAVWWHTTVRPTLGRLRQWNRCEFEASLG